MRVISTGLAFLLVASPCCEGFFYSPVTRLIRRTIAPPATTTARTSDESRTSLWASGESPSRRARFIETVAKSVLTVAVSGGAPLLLPADPSYAYEEAGSRWLPEGNPKAAASWFPLLTKCFLSLEDVLANWDKYAAKQDGDAIRRLIGTIGVSSPLSSVRKAFISIRDAEEESQGDIDVIAYVEAYLEVLTALGDAENDLYSANFADYAGGGGTKASQFITKANKSLKIAREQFKEVNRILGI